MLKNHGNQSSYKVLSKKEFTVLNPGLDNIPDHGVISDSGVLF